MKLHQFDFHRWFAAGAATAVMAVAVLGATTANADGVNWSIGINVPAFIAAPPEPPMYYPAPLVVAPPPRIYYNVPIAPTYYRRAPPVYYPPESEYYGPPPVEDRSEVRQWHEDHRHHDESDEDRNQD